MTTTPTEHPTVPTAAAPGAATAVPAATHIPHPHLARRAAAGPVKAAEQLLAGSALARLSTRLGVKITSIVGTMQCAYLFAALALVSLPDAIKGGTSTTVQWTAQTFLQLVLLSIIMVGQNVQSAAGDARAKATFDDGEAILHYVDGHAKNITHLRAELDEGLAQVHAKLDDNLDTMHHRFDQVAVLAAAAALPPPAMPAALADSARAAAPPVPPAPEAQPSPPPTTAAPSTPPAHGPTGTASTS